MLGYNPKTVITDDEPLEAGEYRLLYRILDEAVGFETSLVHSLTRLVDERDLLANHLADLYAEGEVFAAAADMTPAATPRLDDARERAKAELDEIRSRSRWKEPGTYSK